MKYEWFGSFDDVLARLKDYKTLPFHYDGPLPEERPLVIEDEGRQLSRFILREDGTEIQCLKHNDRVLFSRACHISPAVRNSQMAIERW